MDFVTTSDISAAITGAGFANVYGMNVMQQTTQSFVISVIARMAAQSEMFAQLMVVKLDKQQKNELVVAILSAAASYWKKGSIMKGALSGVSIDLVSVEVIKMLGLADSAILSTASVSGPASATTSGTSTTP